ncbi:MAG: preprotein translocase subunit YajC [Hyphomicrobiales bacterium]
MFVTPAYAQGLLAGGGQNNWLLQIMPIILIMIIFYFLLIRPQQKRARQHQEMVDGIRRGDMVVTGGGLVGKVTKITDDTEIQVELAENVRVRVLKNVVSDVRAKSKPAAKNENAG